MKHTQGHWHVVPAFEHNQYLVLSSHEGHTRPVASIDSDGLTRLANAHLIASAPLMLAALELIQNDNRLMNALSIEQRTAVMDAIRNAGGAE